MQRLRHAIEHPENCEQLPRLGYWGSSSMAGEVNFGHLCKYLKTQGLGFNQTLAAP